VGRLGIGVLVGVDHEIEAVEDVVLGTGDIFRLIPFSLFAILLPGHRSMHSAALVQGNLSAS
jgi:hypothetical protein